MLPAIGDGDDRDSPSPNKEPTMMTMTSVATMLVIAAVPVACFALGWLLCAMQKPASNKPAKVPDRETMGLRKGW
jgi:hypothetical protein